MLISLAPKAPSLALPVCAVLSVCRWPCLSSLMVPSTRYVMWMHVQPCACIRPPYLSLGVPQDTRRLFMFHMSGIAMLTLVVNGTTAVYVVRCFGMASKPGGMRRATVRIVSRGVAQLVRQLRSVPRLRVDWAVVRDHTRGMVEALIETTGAHLHRDQQADERAAALGVLTLIHSSEKRPPGPSPCAGVTTAFSPAPAALRNHPVLAGQYRQSPYMAPAADPTPPPPTKLPPPAVGAGARGLSLMHEAGFHAGTSGTAHLASHLPPQASALRGVQHLTRPASGIATPLPVDAKTRKHAGSAATGAGAGSGDGAGVGAGGRGARATSAGRPRPSRFPSPVPRKSSAASIGRMPGEKSSMQKVAEAYAHRQSSFRYNSHSHSRPKLARSTSQKTVRIHSDVDHLRPRRQSSLGSFSSGAGRDDLQFLEISGADAQLKYMAGEVNVEDIAEAQLEFVALLRAEFWAAMQNGHLSHLALSALLLACDRGEVRHDLRSVAPSTLLNHMLTTVPCLLRNAFAARWTGACNHISASGATSTASPKRCFACHTRVCTAVVRCCGYLVAPVDAAGSGRCLCTDRSSISTKQLPGTRLGFRMSAVVTTPVTVCVVVSYRGRLNHVLVNAYRRFKEYAQYALHPDILRSIGDDVQAYVSCHCAADCVPQRVLGLSLTSLLWVYAAVISTPLVYSTLLRSALCACTHLTVTPRVQRR